MLASVEYQDLGGGLNQDAAPAARPRSQFLELENWYPYDTKLRRRGGSHIIATPDAATDIGQITGIHTLSLRGGAWYLIAGHRTGFSKQSGNVLIKLDLNTSPICIMGDSAFPWCLYQYKDLLYGVRPGGTGFMYRVNSHMVSFAGLSAPTTAPTIAQGAVGNLPAGDYRVVVAYGNRATGYRSTPGPVSNTLTLAANRTIDYTGIPVSGDPFLDQRIIGRTLENQTGTYFEVVTINDMVTTTLSGENSTVDLLGAPLDLDLAKPPQGLKVAAVFNERVFASDGRDLIYSETLQAEGFPGDNVFEISPEDGHEIRALHAFEDKLVIGKTNKRYYLVGSSASTFSIKPYEDGIGCMSGASMKSVEGKLFWYGSGRNVYMSDSSGVARGIGDPRVRDTLAKIDDISEEYIVGEIFPEYNWYVLSVPTGETLTSESEGAASSAAPSDNIRTTTHNRVLLVYNYKTDAWTIFTHPSFAPQCLGHFFSETGERRMYASFYDENLYRLHDPEYPFDEEDTPFTAVFRTRPEDLGAPGILKTIDAVWLLLPRIPNATMRLEVLGDEEQVLLDRTVNLDVGSKDWRVYKIPTWGRPATQPSLRGTLNYSGLQQPIDLEQIHFEVGLLSRPPDWAR